MADDSFTLSLPFRPPFDWPGLLAFFGPRAIPGIERIEQSSYARVVAVGKRVGVARVRLKPSGLALSVDLSPGLRSDVAVLEARLREAFDLAANPAEIAAALGPDERLGPLVRRSPGLRLPGAVDPFEMAVRAVVGQQISVRAAITLAGRLVACHGASLESGAQVGLTHRFPTAAELSQVELVDLAAIGLPRRRAETLRELASLFASGELDVAVTARDAEALVERLVAIPGIGDWTAQYLLMRAFAIPDAFPAGDLGVRKALGGVSAADARRHAEAWRPWRSYAVIHLWSELARRG